MLCAVALFWLAGSALPPGGANAEASLPDVRSGACGRADAPGSRGRPVVVEHIVVYREPGRFGGWPANHGIWAWNDEILVGFSAAWSLKRDPERHQYDPSKPEEPRLARSLDGGRTSVVEAPFSLLPPEQGGAPVTVLRTPVNFRHPDFAMTLRFTDTHKGPSRWFYSTDRGRTWYGPYQFPLPNRQGIAARTDYFVNDRRDAFVFVAASKSNGREGRPLCACTLDGGLSWQFVSWITDEPQGFAIMPSTVRLSWRRMLTAVRVKQDQQQDWIDLYQTRDNGASWRLLCRPVPSTGGHSGNPPSMIRLRDGRLCLTYGYRGRPYGIRARLSEDGGRSWGEEIVLRDDGAAWDIGYVRSVQRPDGRIVSVCYFADQPFNERFIAATIWDPGPRRSASRGVVARRRCWSALL